MPVPTRRAERHEVVLKWLRRFQIIKGALDNFPTLRRSGTSQAGSPGPHMSSANSASTPMGSETDTTRVATRSPTATANCRERDNYTCVVTGRRSSDGFALEVAHIIPFALAKSADCRSLDFWRMLELFYGVECTNSLFKSICDNINDPSNLVLLDNSIHAMFDNCSLLLLPLTHEGRPIDVLGSSQAPLTYNLQIVYPKGKVTVPELIQSTKLLKKSGTAEHDSQVEGENGKMRVMPVLSESQVQIKQQDPDSKASKTTVYPLPSPGYFALRRFVLFLWFTSRQRR